MDMGGRKRVEWNGMNEESSMETYILSYVKIKNSQWEFSGRLRELKLELCDNLEGWDEVGGGRELQKGGHICIAMTDSCSCMTKTNTML